MSYQHWHTVHYPYTGEMYIQETQKGCDTRKEMNALSDTEVDQTYCIRDFWLSL